MSKEKEVIDTKTLLTRFKRFGLKVPLEELNKIPEELQRQIYSDLGYFHKQMYNEIALKKETAYCYRQIGPNRILYIIVNHNRTTLLVRDSNIKKITQYISAKELDRFSKADRSILNALSNFNEQKDATLVHTVNELRRYIHISLNKNITRGSPKIVPKSLNGYQIDNDFEYDIPCLSEEEKIMSMKDEYTFDEDCECEYTLDELEVIDRMLSCDVGHNGILLAHTAREVVENYPEVMGITFEAAAVKFLMEKSTNGTLVNGIENYIREIGTNEYPGYVGFYLAEKYYDKIDGITK